METDGWLMKVKKHRYVETQRFTWILRHLEVVEVDIYISDRLRDY